MFRKDLLVTALASLLSLPAMAQDKIFKRNGETIEGKVTQLSYIDITYKRYDNPDGPDYVISKREVARIVYENGVEERIIYGRKRPGSIDLDKKRAADYSHNNIISVAPLNITQSGTGIGLAYEHRFGSKGRFAFYLPVAISVLGFDNSDNDIAPPVGWLSAISRDRSILQVAPGVKFYPTGSRGKIRYAVGVQLMYAGGYVVERQFNYRRNDPSSPPAPLHNPYKNLRVLQAGAMINNSLNLSAGPHFYVGADLGLGIMFINQKEVFTTGEMKQKPENGLAQFSVKLGYRF